MHCFKFLASSLVCCGFLGDLDGKESACSAKARFDSWVEKIPWRRTWQLTLVFLPGESQGQRISGLQSVGPQTVGRVTHTLGLLIGFSTENVNAFPLASQLEIVQPGTKPQTPREGRGLGHGKVCWGPRNTERWVFLDKIPGRSGPTAVPRVNTWVLLEYDCLLQWLGPRQQQEWPRREDENHDDFMLQTVRSPKWGNAPAFSLLHPWGFS